MPPLTNRLRAYPIRQIVQPLGSIAQLASVKVKGKEDEIIIYKVL